MNGSSDLSAYEEWVQDDDRTLIAFLARPTGREGVDRVLQALLAGLVNGRYGPNEKLNAAKIAKEIDVSIVPVREALHLLAGQGVVELLPQRGARMKGLTPGEVEGWHDIVRVITLVALRQAARCIKSQPANIRILTRAIEVIKQLPEGSSNGRIMSAIFEFHRRINEFSGAHIVDEATRRLQVVHWVNFVVQHAPLTEYLRQISINYQRIADAISIADADSAVTAFNYQYDFLNALIRGERPDPLSDWLMETPSISIR